MGARRRDGARVHLRTRDPFSDPQTAARRLTLLTLANVNPPLASVATSDTVNNFGPLDLSDKKKTLRSVKRYLHSFHYGDLLILVESERDFPGRAAVTSHVHQLSVGSLLEKNNKHAFRVMGRRHKCERERERLESPPQRPVPEIIQCQTAAAVSSYLIGWVK